MMRKLIIKHEKKNVLFISDQCGNQDYTKMGYLIDLSIKKRRPFSSHIGSKGRFVCIATQQQKTDN
jgi:hypothetical protein